MTTRLAFIIPVLAATLAVATAQDSTPLRERLLLDRDWRFSVGTPELGGGVNIQAGLSVDLSQTFGAFAKAACVGGPAAPDFKDESWRRVHLPHDWAVELPFHEKADVAHGCKPVGPQFPASSVAWYRRVFDIPASDAMRRIEVQFDGVFRDSEVYLNGHYLGRNFSGYAPFAYDLTPYLNYGGANTLAVKVNATSFEGWFYEGAGIYRHVWLVKTSPVHIPQWGTWITSEVTGDPAAPSAATLTVRTTVKNESDRAASVRLHTRVLDGDAKLSAEADAAEPTAIAPWEQVEIIQTIPVAKPRLWDVDSPHLYQVETTVRDGDAVVDTFTTHTGIRTIRFDPANGFFLNGRRVFMKGTCNHQDHAGVGVAIPDRLNVWRLEQLKKIGCNAYRASHNPPTPEVLDACDRLGILVMDENRTVGATDEALSQLDRLIRRDRNHPSVVMWCLGNEEMAIQKSDTGARIASVLQRAARKLDPTRPTTLAMNGHWGEGFSPVVDVQGGNYLKLGGGFDNFHKRFPLQPVLGSEEGSHTTTRGIYQQDDALRYCHADESKAKFPSWASTAEAWMKHYAERPYLGGSFVWTGFDYRGEPTPYHQWPNINSNFGILDTCGFPKDIAHYYRAWWTDEPVLHLQPHWNWPDRVGQPIDVRCDGNAEEVELWLNGKSLGRKPMPRLGHLAWPGVIYQPGTLLARGYTGGRQVSETKVETTGKPAAVQLTPDRAAIRADAEDVAVITVSIADAVGLLVPTANLPVTFTLTGPGRILGMGNGDPLCHEPDQIVPPSTEPWRRSTFHGLAQIIVQAGTDAGDLVLTATADGLQAASLKIPCTPAARRPWVP
jgi:beta-galactosidase